LFFEKGENESDQVPSAKLPLGYYKNNPLTGYGLE
jgi:hypothetical protein